MEKYLTGIFTLVSCEFHLSKILASVESVGADSCGAVIKLSPLSSAKARPLRIPKKVEIIKK